MGLGLDWVWDLCAGLFYEHRFAMLIKTFDFTRSNSIEYKINSISKGFVVLNPLSFNEEEERRSLKLGLFASLLRLLALLTGLAAMRRWLLKARAQNKD